MAHDGRTTISKRDILVFLFKRKWCLLTVTLSVTLLVTAFVYLLPTSYTATAKVLVEAGRSPTLRTEARLGTEVAEALYTEIEIVLSRTVMEAVVDKLGLDRLPGPSTPIGLFIAEVRARLTELGLLDDVPARERWVRALLRDIDVKPILDTHVFTIRFSNQNPQLAADIVNAVTDEYMENHLRIYSYENAVSFYRDNMERAKRELDSREAEFDGLDSVQDPVAENTRRASLSVSATQLRERVSQLTLELTSVLSRYAPDHPRAVVLREQINATREALADVQRQIRTNSTDKGHFDGLRLQVESQRETYRSYKQQYDQALLSAIAGRQMINVHVVDAAAVPARPRFPRLLYILLALLAGGLLGVAIALIREYYDHRVDGPESVERLLGVPVIGSLPRVRFGRP